MRAAPSPCASGPTAVTAMDCRRWRPIAPVGARPPALPPRPTRRPGLGLPPVAAYRARGVPSGLGTDSVASVDPADLWEEVRVAACGGRNPGTWSHPLAWGRKRGGRVGWRQPRE